MKTLRYRLNNTIKPGILDKENNIRDASSLVNDWDNNSIVVQNLNSFISSDLNSLPIVEKIDSIAPCLAKESIGKFICIGLNYADHAEETGQKVPPEPIIFFKATSAVVGPNDNIKIPKNSLKSDWEVELGVIIGKEAKYINESDSQSHIAGYCVVNDLSERKFQIEHSGQWVKGKSCDTFGPIGPYFAQGLGNYPRSMLKEVNFGRKVKKYSPTKNEVVYCLPKEQKFPVNTKKKCSAALSYARYAPNPCNIATCVQKNCKKYPTVGSHSILIEECKKKKKKSSKK